MRRPAEMTIDTDIIVVGGGHAGLTVACGLSASFDVTLIDPDPAPKLADLPAAGCGRSIAMLAGSVEIIRSLGVWPELARLASPIIRTEVHETSERVVYDADELRGEPFGYGFENGPLRAGLAEAFARLSAGPGGHGRVNTSRLVGLRSNAHHIVAELADGSSLRARLLIGADGRGSKVRTLAGIGVGAQKYPQSAITFIIEHDQPHGHRVREFIRPEGPLAFLSLSGNRTGVTWVDGPDAADALNALPDAALIARLQDYLAGELGELRLASPRSIYPLGALHADRYAAPRIVLIGDAAHGVHPIHAQGFNMGVQDIRALLDQLSSAKGQRDPGAPDLLVAYERERRPANTGRLIMTDMLARVLGSDWLPVRQARRSAFKALSSVTPLRRFAAARGMQA